MLLVSGTLSCVFKYEEIYRKISYTRILVRFENLVKLVDLVIPACIQRPAYTGDGVGDTSVRRCWRHRGGRGAGVETTSGASTAEEPSADGQDHRSRRMRGIITTTRTVLCVKVKQTGLPFSHRCLSVNGRPPMHEWVVNYPRMTLTWPHDLDTRPGTRCYEDVPTTRSSATAEIARDAEVGDHSLSL